MPKGEPIKGRWKLPEPLFYELQDFLGSSSWRARASFDCRRSTRFHCCLLVVDPLIDLSTEGSHNPKHEQRSGQRNQGKPSEALPETFIERTVHDPVAAFTAALAFFSLVLTVVSIVQIRFLIRADETARIAADAATKSAQAAEKAVAIATERPWLFLSGAFQLTTEPSHVDGMNPFVTYDAANHGKAPAIIEDIMAEFSLGDWPPPPPMRADENNSLFVSPILGIGETRRVAGFLPDGIDCTLKEIDDPLYGSGYIGVQMQPKRSIATPKLAPNDELIFWVIVTYRGPSTSGHQTSACWRWNDGEGHFVQAGRAEYNYTK